VLVLAVKRAGHDGNQIDPVGGRFAGRIRSGETGADCLFLRAEEKQRGGEFNSLRRGEGCEALGGEPGQLKSRPGGGPGE